MRNNAYSNKAKRKSKSFICEGQLYTSHTPCPSLVIILVSNFTIVQQFMISGCESLVIAPIFRTSSDLQGTTHAQR